MAPSERNSATFIALVFAALITTAGVGAWTLLAPLNARFHPESPWAALAMGAFLALMLWWLNGGGPPAATRERRRFLLRLWRRDPRQRGAEAIFAVAGFSAAAIALYPILIFVTPQVPPEALDAYPTTAYRISVLIMGALVSGVVEEAAFRGYMLSKLEPFGEGFALPVMAGAFALSHLVHGIDALPMLPGLFIAGMLYGYLALRSGSLIPGMIIHSTGDAAVTYFGALGGDASLLIAP